MINKFTFKKKILVSAIAYASLGMAVPAVAQTNDTADEIIVTGIKGSLIRATDIKREASGVVDAISSEDLGKMPDTNLAESLQRISGVSIDRSNNEGSRVTVRGFGPEFNLVTLNGRQMPTAQVSDGVSTTATATRSFDFANLASESVNGVEVYKTGRADKSSGGIGSLINIKTARPLSSPGLKASLGVKAVMDTSNVNGDDLTPEVSGLFSDTFADDIFGIALSFAHQQRDSRDQNAKVTGWLPNQAIGGTVTNNNKNPEGNTWYPRSIALDIGDNTRTRDNGQLTLQYAPVDTIKTTLDYTYSKLEAESNRDAFGLWFNAGGATNSATINEHGTVVELNESGGDYSTNASKRGFINENKSLGFNVEWDVSDTLSVNADYHDSVAQAKGTGYANDAWFVLGDTGIVTKTFDTSKGLDIPQFDVAFTGGRAAAPEFYDGLFGSPIQDFNKNDIQQLQLAGAWKNAGEGALKTINFGVASTNLTTRVTRANPGLISGGFYGNNQNVFDDSWFTRRNASGLFDQFSGGAHQIKVPYYYSFDFEKVVHAAEQAFGGTYTHGPVTNDDSIEEDTNAAYVQFTFQGNFNDRPLNLLTGMRYETTDVAARSLELPAQGISWNSGTEFSTVFASSGSYSNVKADYNIFLPSLDANIEIVDDVIARFSYSKTITRSDLTSMRGTTTVVSQPKLGSRTASQGNPALKPYTSDNIDLSLEYYFNDASYVSVGLFNKQVDNFLTTTNTTKTINGITDPYVGPRATLARTQLTAAGTQLTDANIFNQILANGGGNANNRIVGSADDTLAVWTVSTPTNATTLSVHGVEIAAQYVFGDSGFGISSNLTLVKGDTNYEVEKLSTQSALVGLSDTANLVAFYEKNSLQVRIAYNWRDEFLSALTQAQSVGEPVFTEAYGQFDANASYKITDALTVFVEGTNLTDSVIRLHGRYKEQFLNGFQYGPRYNLGARYTF